MTIETEADNGSDRGKVGEEVKVGEAKNFQEDPLDEAKQSWWWGNRTDFWALRCRACQQATIKLMIVQRSEWLIFSYKSASPMSFVQGQHVK